MTRLLPLGLAALVSTLLLQACGEDARTTASPGPARSTSLAVCADVLPDRAFTSLGWEPAGEPALDSGTCTRTAAQGDVAVQRWPVAAVGGDDLPQAAQQAFEDRCKDLYGQAARRVDWLGADLPSCVALGGRRGQSTILALTTHHTLVEARVSADRPTSPDRLRAGLVELARAGATAF
jgi:hypothetical protein